MPSVDPIVIVGGGHAAAQLCGSLAELKLGLAVHLVSEEPLPPYHRPPLSKAFLKKPDEALMPHRAAAWYHDQGVTLHLGDAAVAIDREAQRLHLRSGATLPYGRLVLATGARARTLPGLPMDAANVVSVRNAADAERLRTLLGRAEALTVLGGGFIGLEVAATARGLGKAVMVLEAAPRLLARSVSPELAAHVLAVHRASGIDIRLGVTAADFEVQGGRVAALVVDGQREPVDLLLPGIGAVPETTLAEAAGLACDNGVVVDAQMRSSDPAILAVGDCTSFPAHALAPNVSNGRWRLESVQNAADQARVAAATLAGRETAYAALPWFWSEQGAMRLQMAGLMPAAGAGVTRHRRPGASEASFSILHYLADRLVCVESVNSPLDHVAARKLLEMQRRIEPAVACDAAVPLKNHIA